MRSNASGAVSVEGQNSSQGRQSVPSTLSHLHVLPYSSARRKEGRNENCSCFHPSPFECPQTLRSVQAVSVLNTED